MLSEDEEFKKEIDEKIEVIKGMIRDRDQLIAEQAKEIETLKTKLRKAKTLAFDAESTAQRLWDELRTGVYNLQDQLGDE